MDSETPKIQKTVLHPGTTFKNFVPGTKVKFHFVTRKCNEDHTVIDDSRKMGKPMELVIGKQFKLEVWELIVQKMAINEVASFVVDKSLVQAYPLISKTLREAQNPEKPRPRHCCGQLMQGYAIEHEDLYSLWKDPGGLEFIIELLEVENPGEYVRESWQLNEEERLKEVEKLRDEGNCLFKGGKVAEAAERYSRAIGFLDQLMICEKPGVPEWKSLKDKKMAILLNFSQCKLSLKEYYEVIEHCSTVLEDNPDNVKALYRRSKALAEVWETGRAREDLDRLGQLDPSLESYILQQLQYLKIKDKEREEDLKEKIKGKLFK